MRRSFAVPPPETPASAARIADEDGANAEEIHAHCREIAQALLSGLANRDLSLVEKHVALLRKSLARLPQGEAARSSGKALLRQEQLDALEGVAEQLESSVNEIRQAAETGFERMAGLQDLLRHLAGPRNRGALAAPVC